MTSSKRNYISPHELRRALSHHCYAGLPLGKTLSVADLYATVASTPIPTSHAHASFHSAQPDWAYVSYVNTESARGSGGMPEWVAADAQVVLDDLYHHQHISTRAVSFDRLVARQMPVRWPALATLHALAVPVICVPPARTVDYARYQIPPQWSADTADYFAQVEHVLRQCAHCVHRCPLEMDPRLLNLAATLRSWPVIEALIASNARGAFISFASLDRFRYTLAWYQVLLQLCMRLFTQRNDPDDDGDELFGPALFQPCQRCVVYCARMSRDEPLTQHIYALEESLASLVAQAQRCCLASPRPGEGNDIMCLQGAFRASGERTNMAASSSALSVVSSASHCMTPGKGSVDLYQQQQHQQQHYPHPSDDALLAGSVLCQPQFEHIAASVVSGRVTLGACFNHADKWVCAFILANIDAFLHAFDEAVGTFPAVCRTTLLTVIRSDLPFGGIQFRPRENIFNQDSDDDGVNRCIRCAPCHGTPDSVSFFNELSGILPPTAVGQLFHTWGLKQPRLRRFLAACETALRKRLHNWSTALQSFEFEITDLTPDNKDHCFHCRRAYARTDQYYTPLILLAWESRPFVPSPIDRAIITNHSSFNSSSPQRQPHQQDNHNQQHRQSSPLPFSSQSQSYSQSQPQQLQPQSPSHSPPPVSPCYTFITFNPRQTKQLWSRGLFNLDDVTHCKLCSTPYARVKVNDTDDSLEIHTSASIPIAAALNNIFDVRSSQTMNPTTAT